MKSFYFTFGCGSDNANCYVEIQAEDYGKAREIMFEHYGDKWAFQYDSAEKAGVMEFGLYRLSLGEHKNGIN